MKLITTLGAAALAAFAAAGPYVNNFESPVGPEWSSTGTSSFNGTTVLGRFDNADVTLTLSGFTVGEAVTVGFDLYILDSWDGDGTTYGPDHFHFAIDGVDQLNTTFSNVAGSNQAFPDAFGSGSHDIQTGADNKDFSHGGTLPDGYFGNALYIFGGAANAQFAGVATATTMTFTFGASNLQGVGDESWALDNVNVSDGSAVPEPCTMVGLGLGAAAMIRRRQKA